MTLQPLVSKKHFHLLIRFLGLLVLAVSLLWGMNNIAQRMKLDYHSPYDEHTHFDYWYKIYHWNKVPAVYERIDNRSLEIWACGSTPVVMQGMTCSPSGKIENNSWSIENTASSYLPTYYLLTAWLSSAVKALVPVDNDFHLAKLTNMVWGFVGLLLMSVLALHLGVPPLLAAMLVAVTAQAPIYVYMATVFNPEVFVLVAVLLGIFVYVRFLYPLQNQAVFLACASLLSALVLSVKPTALLLVVILGVSELLRTPLPWRQRLLRVLVYGLCTVLIYAAMVAAINGVRGGGPSDGSMRDMLIRRLGDRSFFVNMNMVYAQFTHSTASPGWRTLIDWNLPHAFMYLPTYVLILSGLSLIYLVIALSKGIAVTRQAALFAGSAVAFVALPLFLYIYLRLTHFPFFFQARYFLPYLVTSALLGTAFVVSVFRQVVTWHRSPARLADHG
ncbi:MAG: hypothetical protein K0M73_16885 [Hydrogenophaga sp.]|nr:hypothetical protein [Hydrogenophaga sp.]